MFRRSQRVRRVDFHLVRFREPEVRQHLLSRFVHHLRNRRAPLLQLCRNLSPGGMSAFLVGLHEHLPYCHFQAQQEGLHALIDTAADGRHLTAGDAGHPREEIQELVDAMSGELIWFDK